MVQEIDADPLASFWGEKKCALVRPPYQCRNTRRDPAVFLIVEYFKPDGKVYFPIETVESKEPNPQAQDITGSAKIRRILVGKWSVPALIAPQAYGDTDVEFTNSGHVIRTYKRNIISDKTTSYTYKVLENGQLESNTNLKLVKLINDELILSWEGEIISYRRACTYGRLTQQFYSIC